MAQSPDLILEDKTVNAVRIALGAAGLTALIAGLMILVAPAQTAQVIAAIIAVYALIAGLADIVVAIFSKTKGGWGRVGYGLLGLLFLAAGVIALQNLQLFALSLAATISILVGVLWIIEGIVSLSHMGGASSKGLTIIFAALSIIAGAVLVVFPLSGGVTLWWLIGISLVVLGLLQVVRALRFAR